jgi:hypothetical protein
MLGPAYWIGLALIVVGVALRLRFGRPFLDAYAKRYSKAPPRGWLWTSDPDVNVERLRRLAALGSGLMVAGSLFILINLFAH